MAHRYGLSARERTSRLGGLELHLAFGDGEGYPSALTSARKAAIAQLVEHVIRNDGVGGSSPSCGTSDIQISQINNLASVIHLGLPKGWTQKET